MPLPPWHAPSGLDAVIAKWLAAEPLSSADSCITADRTLPATPGVYTPFPSSLPPSLVEALRARGVEQLYAHQAEAYEAARAGKHVVVSTPTASGKSLCFHLPVLEALAREPDASALYLYPTKALARDQEAGLRQLITEAQLGIPAVVYDGDTPGDARRAARERSPIVMTNPDMIHAGILPHHAHWARTLAKLRFVVVDELHTYRGVFGSQVAHVLARLRRAARFHGSNPVFLCATATIGNPEEHAAKLLGVRPEEVALVDRSGAPRGERRLFVYNPPVVNAELGIRASTWKSAVKLAADLVRERVPTIVFGQSRNGVEVMLKYLRDKLSQDGAARSIDPESIMAYRGGYLPETRRRVEQGLRDGAILCVVATNALELGIDIGELDAVVCAGYPGSVAGTWQRFGRAGRRGEKSVAVLVAGSDAVDQYVARTPEVVLDGLTGGAGGAGQGRGAAAAGPESARIDPTNTEILIQHLKCAAFELPFLAGEAYADLPGEDTSSALRFLAGHGVVFESNDRFHWSADAYPANHVSLRSVGWDNFVIIDRATGSTLAELDWRATPTMLHEQAIYQHDGEQYQVEQLDWENHKAFVTKVVPDYFTTAMSNRKVTAIDESARLPIGRAASAWGEVSVVEKVVGFKKIKFHTHENAGYGEVRLPDTQMHTTSFWLTLPESLCEEIGMSRARVIDALRGVAAALETVSALALMCDPRDLGRALGDDGEDGIPTSSAPRPGFDPTLFLFDNVPGGVGLAERIFERRIELVTRARSLVRGCTCASGCPACVGATEAVDARGAVRKRATLQLFDWMLPPV